MRDMLYKPGADLNILKGGGGFYNIFAKICPRFLSSTKLIFEPF